MDSSSPRPQTPGPFCTPGVLQTHFKLLHTQNYISQDPLQLRHHGTKFRPMHRVETSRTALRAALLLIPHQPDRCRRSRRYHQGPLEDFTQTLYTARVLEGLQETSPYPNSNTHTINGTLYKSYTSISCAESPTQCICLL